MNNLIYLISFLEALSNSLIGTAFPLFLTYNLHLTELNVAKVLSFSTIVSTISIIVFGTLIDKLGALRTMVIGSILLVLSRVALGVSPSLNVALFSLVIAAIGGAIKSSSILVYLKQSNKSFKLDYAIFNLGYCVSGILFDMLGHNYSHPILLAGLITFLNLIVIKVLSYYRAVPIKSTIVPKEYTKITLATTLKVNAYYLIMTPISLIFTFMQQFMPKWSLIEMGQNAPIGKLFGSLNPAIIMIIVPITMYLHKKYKINPIKIALIGTLISSLSLLNIYWPIGYLGAVILTVVMFTIGEAMWSPANMEISTHICPPGTEGRLMVLSLLPRTASGLFINFLTAYWLNHMTIHPLMPFIELTGITLLTPICIYTFKGFISRIYGQENTTKETEIARAA